ncbi:hypothetical protein IV102_16890 [bacterium]|nr:hypothetical protein [bacterium]
MRDLQAMLRGLEPQAVYLTRFDEVSPWSFVVYLDDHTQPPGYVFYRFKGPPDALLG